MWVALVGLGCWAWSRKQRRGLSAVERLDAVECQSSTGWIGRLAALALKGRDGAVVHEVDAGAVVSKTALWAALSFIAALQRWQRLRRTEDADDPCAPGKRAAVRAEDSESWRAASDLSSGPRDIVIATSAALPWMTGTSVNPLIRALWLRRDGHRVTLLLPFLAPEQQSLVFSPNEGTFNDHAAQEAYIRSWILEKFGEDGNESTDGLSPIHICFYPSAHEANIDSILPVGDMTKVLDQQNVTFDYCILEEPEHLTWFHYGPRWNSLFRFVLGIAHTNYVAYAFRFGTLGPPKAAFLHSLNRIVCRAYCDRIIKLSAAVQMLPKSVVCNVHGVQENFLRIGDEATSSEAHFTGGVYFLGKALWEKGYRQLLNIARHHFVETGRPFPISFYGGGPNLKEIATLCDKEEALSEVFVFGGALYHGHPDLAKYSVFLNPAVSDVVCTATAEAIAMGKHVVLAEHPSNEFFRQFRNVTLCDSTDSFIAAVSNALAAKPEPLLTEEREALTWDAATRRLYKASQVPRDCTPPNPGGRLAISRVHFGFTKFLQKSMP